MNGLVLRPNELIRGNIIDIYIDDHSNFYEDIENLKEHYRDDVKEINIYVNASECDVIDIVSLTSIMSRYDVKKTLFLDGLITGDFTPLFLVADEIHAYTYSQFRANYPRAFAIGNADNLRDQAEDLERLYETMFDILEAKSAIDRKSIIDAFESKSLIDGRTLFEKWKLADVLHGSDKGEDEVNESHNTLLNQFSTKHKQSEQLESFFDLFKRMNGGKE